MTKQARWLLIVIGMLAGTGAWALSLNGGGDFDGLNQQPPSVDQAIRVSMEPDWQHQRLAVSFDLIPHVYLYRQRLDFALLGTDGKVVKHFPNPPLPAGISRHDDAYGKVTVYYHHLDVSLPVKPVPDGARQLRVRYQGCLENTLCYPPQTRTFPISAPASGRPTPPSASITDHPGFLDTLFSENANSFSLWMGHHDPALVLALFFLGGVLLAFTPCVFPMIPILSGIVAGDRAPSARRGFLLSVAYVLGMAVPYSLAGLLVALFGAGLNLRFLLQRPAAIAVSAAVFALLAGSMFDLFHLQLPGSLRHRLQHRTPGGGNLIGAALLGTISALVVSPCVTPILAGAMLYVAGTGKALMGALSLFALALGMGTPLILFGTGGGHLLPRAGQWMDQVKRFFGVVMLGVAIWLLGRLLDATTTLALYGLLLALYGVHLGALEPVPEGGSRLGRGLAAVLALYGALMLVGAAAGGGDPWQPLAPLSANSSGAAAAADTAQTAPDGGQAEPGGDRWTTLRGPAALDRALQHAAANGRPVLVDFFAQWCVACKELDKNTLSKARVLSAMRGFDLYRIDLTDVTPADRKLMSEYQVLGLPCLIFFDRNGKEIPHARVLGEMGPARFIHHLDDRVKPRLRH